MPADVATPAQLARRITAGERAALSRAITLVESTRPSDRSAANELLAALPPPPQHRLRLGFTGSPGAGKSTLIEAYGSQLLDAGKRVAVLAVDPSSTQTRGSILGDKTRMERLSRDPNAYVRPSPAGTTLGGVTRATREAILLCEAAGYTDILIETVGVGQSEHAVRDLCDCMVLLVLPGGGDELQGIKRGIVELADVVFVNKADGERERLATETARQYGRSLHLQRARSDGWSPRAVAGSAIAEDGLVRLVSAIAEFVDCLGPGGLETARRQQGLRYFDRVLGDNLVLALRADEDYATVLAKLKSALTAGTLSAEVALSQAADAIRHFRKA